MNKDVELVKYIRAGVSGRYSHIAAILLMLSTYVDENGYIVQKPSTSIPCSWNMGKKEVKSPNQLNDIE